MVASEFVQREIYDTYNSAVHERRRRRRKHGLRFDFDICCTKKTIFAIAATSVLVCHSSPVIASSRHIPPTRHVCSSDSRTRSSSTSSSIRQTNNLFRLFLSPRSEDGHRPRVPPSSTSSPSASSLRFSASPNESNEIPPHNNINNNNNTLSSTSTMIDDKNRVTTTSFFRFPSETTRRQEDEQSNRETEATASTSMIRPQQQQQQQQQKTATQAQIQRTFVVSLMGLAGFVEGFCIRRHGCFPNLMTGTILKVVEALGNWNFSMAGIHASMIGCYIGGGFIFSKWKQQHQKQQQQQSSDAAASNNSNHKHEQMTSSLKAVLVQSGLFLLLSDILGGISPLRSFKLPLLAAGYGIINAGTVDVGAGVTYALTGHVTKVGQGLATGSLVKSSSNDKPSTHRISAQGLVVFSLAALVANLVCKVLEQGESAAITTPGFRPLLQVAKRVLERLPLGITMGVAYAWLFRWYLGASKNLSVLEAKRNP